MSRRLKIEWSKRCWACRNPIDICILYDSSDRNLVREITNYATHKPIDFGKSTTFYKTRNGKVYRYCWGCVLYPPDEYCIQEINGREIGKRFIHRPRSLYECELEEWFRGLYEYMNRKDVEDCVIETVEPMWPVGLFLRPVFIM
jgi:hypothetical protein